MLIRANRLSKTILNKFPKSTFIYSEWLGYLKNDNEEYKKIQEIVPNDYIYLHTSGHASPEAIKKVIEVTSPDIVIPIHTDEKGNINKLTNKAKLLEDGEEFIIN
jgi:ribonuclease J